MNDLPCEHKTHQTEHRACQQRYRVRPVEKVYGDIFNLLLVYHSEMHSVIHIILAQGMRSAVHRRHRWTQSGEQQRAAAAAAPHEKVIQQRPPPQTDRKQLK